MTSLVAYDESDNETDEENSITIEVEKPLSNCIHTNIKNNGSESFLTLPKPKSNAYITISDDCNLVEEQPMIYAKKQIDNSIQDIKETSLFPTLPKPKAGGKVKITIPSLNEFYDDDDDYQPKRKIIKPSNSGCGLFSMLPNPKNKKTNKVSTTTSMIPRATMNKISTIKEESKSKTIDIRCFEPKIAEVEDEADDDDQDVDFLGLNKINEIPDVEPVSGFDIPEIKSNTSVIDDEKVYGPVYCPETSKSDIYEDDETKLTLDSNALKQLGDRDKTHIKQVEVINVNMSQVMEESQQWLQKNMSEEYAESRNVNDINITGQSKRKHQITYLAQQAKANELKLKNMWAENRMTRKQTQAKYGF